jgi:hypothetical protein
MRRVSSAESYKEDCPETLNVSTGQLGFELTNLLLEVGIGKIFK